MKHCQQEMTVIQNAWPVVCNFGWLIEADRNARKGKRYRAEVLNFTARLEDNLFTIQQGMMNGSYVLGPYRKLWVYVPKKRLVMALDYPDRIVQWSLYLYLNPIYDRLFIEDSYACRKDKGSHKAAKRLQYWMCQVQRKPGPGWYCLKLDISKYFYRVNHEKLLAILERRVKDPAMMAFIRGVVNSRAEPFGLPRWRTPQDTPPEEWLYEVGMPIGNLTSQLFANIYLNELDQYCKHKLKIHYYIRYMDDVIILGQDKETLHRWKAAVETFLREELALDLNSKTSIFKSITFDNGTEFAAAEELERSCVNKRLPRTKVYFCHPYSSWERGTNENTNGMIRRRFPKGTNFAAVTNAQITQAENWINNYPRKILGYKSSEIVFRECLRELGIAA